MTGETDLDRLIASMAAELVEDVFVFATFPDRLIPVGLSPRMVFQEAEGTTAILLKAEADDHGIASEFPCRMITLNIHSSLQAVGFMARITTALARLGMGVNPVSGYFHDHLFVPDGREQEAMEELRSMAAGKTAT